MSSRSADSIKARLLNEARGGGTEFELFLVRYACERFLYRLGKSSVRDRCISEGRDPFGIMDEGTLSRHTRYRSVGIWRE